MRTTLIARGAAVAAAAALVALSAAPASAATVSQASATALSLDVAGSKATDTGTYSVTNNGSTESSEGTNEPVVSLLSGQKAAQVGTFAQNAVAGKDATSAACSGIAGDGATVVAVGDGDCLKGGNNLTLDVGSLDFSEVELVKSELFMGADKQVQEQLKGQQAQVTSALEKVLTQVVTALGSPGLYVDLGAVQSSCTANAKAAQGDSTIANAKAYALIGGQRVDLIDLPVDPSVNQKVVTDLSGVVDAILDGLRTQLTNGLNGALKEVDGVTKELQTQLLEPLLTAVSEQLAPLEDAVLDITLNKQTRSPGSISVTALDAEVLPAAKQFIGSSLAHLTIGTSKCGPNSPAQKAAPHAPEAKNPPAEAPAAVPTVVTAGIESYDDGSAGRIALVAMLLLVAGGAGAAAYVRTLRRG